MDVKKAVFPVAGLGTRFLPATKANPKEMLPIVDRPLIQYAVDEAVAAGITELIFITSNNKNAIEDHFDSNHALEAILAERGKHELLQLVKDVVPEHVTCAYVRQKSMLGLGHAVLCAKRLVNDEPFAVLLADDLIHNESKSCLAQMIDVHNKAKSSIVAVKQVADNETEQYGIVAVDDMHNSYGKIAKIIEKPKLQDAPSRLGVVGRYILTPRIFDFLEQTKRGAGGEIQLTDAIAALLHEENIYAYEFQGTRYDCGSKLGYLKATVAYALRRSDLSCQFKDHLKEVLANAK